jgi:hypothetical protein
MSTHDLGDMVRVKGTWTDAAGAPVAPTAVTLTVKNPAGVATTPALTNPSAGVYYADVDANVVGTWCFRFRSTGSGQAAAEGRFYVRESQFD